MKPEVKYTNLVQEKLTYLNQEKDGFAFYLQPGEYTGVNLLTYLIDMFAGYAFGHNSNSEASASQILSF